MSQVVRLGIVGVSSMGLFHAAYLREEKIHRCKLAAVCDADPKKLAGFSDIKTFTDSQELIRSGLVDAVIVATPHYFHTTIGIDALENGLHVLVEKPLSVHKADCQRLLAAHRNEKQVFATMLNLRTDPRYRHIKKLIEDGELGDLVRITWIITDCFRPDAYYYTAGWRGTWKGEGGGVLINQCPHHLDLLQWFTGMPSSIRAFCGFGARHDIEVEDQVTAYLEYANGGTGVFIASTGECPGTNRLEIVGEMGRILFDGGHLTFTRNDASASEFIRTTNEPFGRPDITVTDLSISGNSAPHEEITQNFVDAILDGIPLIAPASEGINAVELANAMLYSTLTNDTVQMPLDAQAFEQAHAGLIARSTFVKNTSVDVVADMARSFRG